MDIARLFEHFAGAQVRYVSHIRDTRQMSIDYRIPSFDETRIFRVSGHLRNGLMTTQQWLVRRLAQTAMNEAYRRSGQYNADLQQLLQGKTV